MHIVVIAWAYVVFMMAVTESSVIAGIMTFLIYGVIPLSIILYLGSSAKRKQKKADKKNQQITDLSNSNGSAPSDIPPEDSN